MSAYTPDGVWAKARALLVGYWPNLATQLIEEDGSDSDTAALWRTEFAPFRMEDLLAGIREMALRLGNGYPSLPVLLPYLRAARAQARQEVPSLASSRYVAVEQWENDKIAELRSFAKNYPGTWTEYELDERIARIRSEGPFFQRVCGLQDGTDERTTDEWWSETFPSAGKQNGPESLAELLGVKQPEGEAASIAAEFKANPEAWPKERIEALADDVRREVRALLAVRS